MALYQRGHHPRVRHPGAAGAVVEETRFTWDGASLAELRFPGQYHDPETGLDYNYQRYYDPTTARYTAPDPPGLSPAPHHHAYVDNPLTSIDALGLAGSYGPPIPIRAGQQAPGRTYALSSAEKDFVNRLTELKPNYQIFRTDGTASQGDFVVMDMSDPKNLVGWNVELKTAHGGFPGEQFRNSDELKSIMKDYYDKNTKLSPRTVELKPAAGTPDEMLDKLNQGRGEWCDK